MYEPSPTALPMAPAQIGCDPLDFFFPASDAESSPRLPFLVFVNLSPQGARQGHRSPALYPILHTRILRFLKQDQECNIVSLKYTQVRGKKRKKEYGLKAKRLLSCSIETSGAQSACTCGSTLANRKLEKASEKDVEKAINRRSSFFPPRGNAEWGQVNICRRYREAQSQGQFP